MLGHARPCSATRKHAHLPHPPDAALCALRAWPPAREAAGSTRRLTSAKVPGFPGRPMLKRRDFLRATLVTAGALVVPACGGDPETINPVELDNERELADGSEF